MKLGLKLGLDVYRPSGSSYDAATQAVFDYAASQGYTEPSDDVKSALDTMIIALKGAGIWNKLEIIYVLVTDGDRDFAKINIKNPGTIQFENVSGNAYIISVAGVTAPLGGGLVVSDVSAGQKQVKVDSSGNIRIIEVQVLPCDTSMVVL